jgi:hypothetical protein
MLKRLLGWGLLLVVLAGCAGTQLNSPSVFVGYSKARASEHFDSDDGNWDTFTAPNEQALFSIDQGMLQGAVVANRGYIWSLDKQPYSNTGVEVKVQQTRGAQGNGFGLLCRADESGDGYYFVISSAGQFAILKGDLKAGIDPIPLVDWQNSSAIKQGFEPNVLQATCLNDYLAFSANGYFLGEARDTTFSSGQIGVVLGAAGETAWVNFDDVIVRDASVIR